MTNTALTSILGSTPAGPTDLPNFKPLVPGEHPRLFFGQTQTSSLANSKLTLSK